MKLTWRQNYFINDMNNSIVRHEITFDYIDIVFQVTNLNISRFSNFDESYLLTS